LTPKAPYKTGSDPILLAVSDRRVLGFIAMHVSQMVQYERPVMRVTALVVDCRARRRGIGKLLMDRAESLASSAGCEIVELTSAATRADAHAFIGASGISFARCSSLNSASAQLFRHKRVVSARLAPPTL
jgi:GNAT superfamily N-acetyltransferase